MLYLFVLLVYMLVVTGLFWSNLGRKRAGIFWSVCLGVTPLIFFAPQWLVWTVYTIQFFNGLIYYVVARYGDGP